MSRKNRGGRPPGHKNREYASVVEIPPSCPTCGGTNLRVVPGSEPNIMDHAGEVGGHSYTRIVWRRKQCQCGQLVSVRTYEKETTAGSLIA